MVAANHVASVAHKAHAHHTAISHVCHGTKCSAKTHAAPALTWVSSATTLTNANRPAMCQQASHHLACLRAVAVADEAETVVAIAVEAAAVAAGTSAAVAVEIRAAGLAALGAN